MNYDPSERFREDPGEFELDPNFQAQLDLERQAAEQQAALEAQQQQEESTPTGGQPKQTQPQASSTDGDLKPVETSPFKTESGEVDLEKLRRQGGELDTAFLQGIQDFGIDLINIIPGVNIKKPSEYENDVAEAVRNISSVVVPTMTGSAALRGLGVAANARVGWSLGSNPFVRFLGERGVEALAGLGVGAVSSEYEEDNLSGTLKQSFPKTFDFIPDSMATLEGDSPDVKRQKNINEDLGLGIVTDLAMGASRLVTALGGTASSLRKSNRLVGQTDEARAWLRENAPEDPLRKKAQQLWDSATNTKGRRSHTAELGNDFASLTPEEQDKILEMYLKNNAISDSAEDVVARSAMKQEEALDEVGFYNLSLNPDLDRPLKGVHDMFDYSEIGVRTVDDFGIVGASVDAARIANNSGTIYGRIGNSISEPALKYALTNYGAGQDIVLGLADQLRKAGEIGAEGNGWKINYADVIEANENVAIQLFDPRMSKQDLREILEPYIVRGPDGTERLTEAGFGMTAAALRNFGSVVTGMDVARAQSLLAGSLSGRISDLSEGARLMTGTSAVREAQEKVIDLMQYVSQLGASAKYYKNRKMGLLQQVRNGFTNIEGYNEASVIGAGAVAERVFKDSERFASTLRQIADNQPELMDDLLFAYELTDGRVDTILKMNNYIAGMTTDLGKIIFNPNPEVQNKLIQGMWSNIYNSVLSAFGTPIKALVGNFGGIISQPISHFGGAIAHGDFEAIHRGWIAYSSVGETLKKALPYAGDIFMRASKEPESVRSVTRLDLALQSEREIGFLKQAARTKAAQGEMGLQYIVSQIEMLNAFSKDPVLRFGPNAMTATDGFTGVFNASAEARFRAMDELRSSGKPITKENVKPIADKLYKEMFDSNGILSDEAVKYANSEIALNLDSPIAQGITDLIDRVPAVRPFLMFQTTGLNTLDIGGKYAPWAPFQKDINELVYTKLDDLLVNEEYVDNLLRSRNINPDQMDPLAKQAKIADLKYTAMGRKAIGTMTIAGAVGLLMNDRLTGDGLYDKETQRSRVTNSNWQPRSIKGLDGKWYSYESLGPLADVLALTANIGDNFDMLGEVATENLLKKLIFSVGASVTDRTGLSTIRPLVEAASGDTSAMTRWGAGFINSLGPLSGQRAEWGRIFSKGLQIVDNDLMSMLQNRNRFAGELDSTNRAPYIYSPVTGKTTNDYTFMQRLWNATGVMKIGAEQTPEEKFLQEVEFDINTTFRTKDGVKLLPAERSELFRLMGEQGVFRGAIKDIMKDAGDWNSLAMLRQKRSEGYTADEASLSKWYNIHVRLSDARRVAEELAFAEMDADMFAAIQFRQLQRDLSLEASQYGETIDNSLNIRK